MRIVLEKAISSIWDLPKPVSYTHLDVYKRQINTTSLNLLQIVAEKHENASILNYHELARYRCV